MRFRLVPKSVTLNGPKRRNGLYIKDPLRRPIGSLLYIALFN